MAVGAGQMSTEEYLQKYGQQAVFAYWDDRVFIERDSKGNVVGGGAHSVLVLAGQQVAQQESKSGWFAEAVESIWHSNIARTFVPDIITVDVTFSAAFGVGASATWTFNVITRGKDNIITGNRKLSDYVTFTGMNRYGAEIDSGINGGFLNYTGNPRELTLETLAGPSYNISAGYIYSGSVN
jgi:hypothetical protein